MIQIKATAGEGGGESPAARYAPYGGGERGCRTPGRRLTLLTLQGSQDQGVTQTGSALERLWRFGVLVEHRKMLVVDVDAAPLFTRNLCGDA